MAVIADRAIGTWPGASAWAIGTLVVKRTDWAGMGLGITTWQMALSIPPMLLGAFLFEDGQWSWPRTEIVALTCYIAAIPIAPIVDRMMRAKYSPGCRNFSSTRFADTRQITAAVTQKNTRKNVV